MCYFPHFVDVTFLVDGCALLFLVLTIFLWMIVCLFFKDMLTQPDKNIFFEAMEVEITNHTERDHWDLIPRSQLPSGSKTIMSVWSFKRKRLPDGTICKYKARLYAHGGQQQWGVDYWETYTPVVQWISVRTLLILSEIYGLKSGSIDFVLAFPQVDLDVPVFMRLPIGFDVESDPNGTYVLRLKKNLYGLKQAAKNWFDMLSDGLIARDFVPSATDPCVYYRHNAIILVYTDDYIIFAKK